MATRLATVVAGTVLAAGCARGPATVAIAVDGTVRHQRMVAWEASDYIGEDEIPTLPFRDSVIDQLVDLGVNRIRLQVKSGSETNEDFFLAFDSGRIDRPTWRAKRYVTTNDNDDPNLINEDGFSFTELDRKVELIVNPFRERLRRAGGKPLVNLCYTAFTGQITAGGQYLHDDPREYGEFIEATWRHLDRKYGWVPDGLEVILEPDNVPQWNGTLIGQAIVEVARRLLAAGFAVPRFVAPSNTNMRKAVRYFDDAMRVKGVRGLLTEFSYHRYGGVSRLSLLKIRARARHYGVQTSMLEMGVVTAHTLYEDLTVGQNSAWSEFVISSPEAGRPGQYFYLDQSSPKPRIGIEPTTRHLGHYFKFIRPGAVRLEAVTRTAGFLPVAFENENGGWVVVILCERPGALNITGLPAGTYGITLTTDQLYNQQLSDVTIGAADPVRTSISAPGVVTIHARK